MTTFQGANEECNTDARLYVQGQQIPYANRGLSIEIRKEGAADLTRQTEAVIPRRWPTVEGSEASVAEQVNGLSGQLPRRQHATVEVIDPRSGEHVPVHSGYISTAGGHSDRGAARFLISDYADLLGRVPASVTFDEDASLRSVLEYIRRTLIEGQSVIDDLSFAIRNIAPDTEVDDDTFDVTDVDEEQGEAVEAFLQGETVAEEDVAEGDLDAAAETFEEGAVRELGNLLGVFSFDALATPTSFSADRDTLVDVMQYINRHHNIRWYFRPREPTETPQIVLDGNPSTAAFHDENHLDGEPGSQGVRILENNALFQLSPPHRLTARGRTASLTETPMTWLTDQGGPNQFPRVTTQYEPLAEQTDVEEAPIEIETETFTTKETENIAKSELKDRLDGAAGGEMTLPPTPDIHPYAELRAPPICQSEALYEQPPISYEVERVSLLITTGHTDTDPPSPRTIINVGLYVDPEKITTAESRYLDA